MKLIDLTSADWFILGPILQKRADSGLPPYGSDWRIFPNMRASSQVLVFSSAYMVAISDWWNRYRAATGIRYEDGSAMCESGVAMFNGHVHESLMPFRGVGPVPQDVIDEARSLGRNIPEERLGDFTPGLYRLNIRIPAGASVNGVSDGGHSTVAILVEQPDGSIVLLVWEWQSSVWTEFEVMINRGIEVVDVADQ